LRGLLRSSRMLAIFLAVSLLATGSVATAQSVDWSDQGEYFGFFIGGGDAAGAFEGVSFKGTVVVTGGFSFDISPDGTVTGDYELVYDGAATSSDGAGSQVISESGLIVGDTGTPVLSRQVASVATTVDGFTLRQGPLDLPPSPAPLTLTHSQCGFVEGAFNSKLDGLQQAFSLFGIDASQEEGFTAIRLDEITDAELKRQVLEAMDALGKISRQFVPLIVVATTDLDDALGVAEDLVNEAEAILADLDGLALCGEDVDTKLFRLGLSKAVNRFVNSVLPIAVDQSDETAVVRLGIIAARSGTLVEVFAEGEKAIDLLATEAISAEDLPALRTLLIAALIFQATDQFIRIEDEVRKLEELGA